MSIHISVDRHHLRYLDGARTLILPVEWSFVAKTPDHPADFEILAHDLSTWTEPAGTPIDPGEVDSILDRIAAYYAESPAADILGPRGALLRGVSRFRFYLGVPPAPSRYYEPGHYLEIPTLPFEKGRSPKYLLDFRAISTWTAPRLPLDAQHRRLIEQRISVPGFIGLLF